MDKSTLIATLVGASVSLFGSFGAILFAQFLINYFENKKKYINKIEEINILLVQIKKWEKQESDNAWWHYETNSSKWINAYNCPIDDAITIVRWYEPSLMKNILEIKETVDFYNNIDSNTYHHYQKLYENEEFFADAKKEHKKFEICYQKIEKQIDELRPKKQKRA